MKYITQLMVSKAQFCIYVGKHCIVKSSCWHQRVVDGKGLSLLLFTELYIKIPNKHGAPKWLYLTGFSVDTGCRHRCTCCAQPGRRECLGEGMPHWERPALCGGTASTQHPKQVWPMCCCLGVETMQHFFIHSYCYVRHWMQNLGQYKC